MTETKTKTTTETETRDSALAERFQELRAHDQRHAPPFAPSLMTARKPPRRSVVVFVGFGASVAAAAAAVALWIVPTERSPASVRPTLVQPVTVVRLEEPPLDFLLDDPQSAFLAKSPSFDVATAQEKKP